MADGPNTVPIAHLARVVIVDDSHLMRERLRLALRNTEGIIVVGTAADPYEAREVIRTTNPNVITLDVEMPKMGGLEFLRHIMALKPTAVIMVSGSTTTGADTTLKAMEIGAFDFVAKPINQAEWRAFDSVIQSKVRAAAGSNVIQNRTRRSVVAHADSKLLSIDTSLQPIQSPAPAPQTDIDRRKRSRQRTSCRLIAVGASTGGVTAIISLLRDLPAAAPAMVIVQHMPKEFTARFAKRLATSIGKNIAEATDGDVLMPGMIRIAPGHRHLKVVRRGKDLICKLGDDPPINNHKPSVDILFSSVASALGEKAIGMILTGMGSDGSAGLLKMRELGARTFGEAECSCTIYGMSKAAWRLGAVEREMPLEDLAELLRCQFADAGKSAAEA